MTASNIELIGFLNGALIMALFVSLIIIRFRKQHHAAQEIDKVDDFLLTGSIKQRIITAGVLVAFCLLLAVPVCIVYINWHALIFVFVAVLIIAGIMGRFKLGYAAGNFIFASVAFIAFFGAFNPFAAMDSDAEGWSFWHLVAIGSVISLISGLMFYCLTEHARLREMR